MTTSGGPLPRIAVTGMWSNQVHGLRFDGSAVAAAVLRAVVRAGGEPLTLFAEHPVAARERLRGFDALLVPGGADVDPSRYGESRRASVSVADFAVQDQFEADMIAAAVDLGLPVLAICRGFQLMNVEHGGTLVPDLPVGSPHRNGRHLVSVQPDSRLASVLGATELSVSSYHHQAVDRVGGGLRVVGTSPDGVVEALESAEPGIEVLAVQWHPEDSAQSEPQQQALFGWLVARARAAAERQGIR